MMMTSQHQVEASHTTVQSELQLWYDDRQLIKLETQHTLNLHSGINKELS